jgi:hypothetical protein
LVWNFTEYSRIILPPPVRNDETDNSKRYEKAKSRLANQGISFVDDKRFVEFLKEEKNLSELICLIEIPNISLNEQFNSPNWKNHPINKLLEGNSKAEDFMVKGTHFPKWFKNDRGELKEYSEWKQLWIKHKLGVDKFVPPRDANKPIKDSKGNTRVIKTKNEKQGEILYPLYALLEQTNLVLICPNGHLSDIPWPKFLRWKSEKKEKNDNGGDLFSLDNCCPTPKLKWTESKTKSEGYGSIYIECTSCGCGNGASQPKINLEGINNLKPNCPGEKPWEIDLGQDSNSKAPVERCHKRGVVSNGKEQMQVALVTFSRWLYAFQSIRAM